MFEMSEVVERLENPMKSVVGAVWYRTLGMNSIHAPIEEIRKFVHAEDNPFGGKLDKYWDGKAYEVWKWKKVNVSEPNAENPIIFDTWVIGGGTNTVFIRERFWSLHLPILTSAERILGLERGTLSPLMPRRGNDGFLMPRIKGELLPRLKALLNSE